MRRALLIVAAVVVLSTSEARAVNQQNTFTTTIANNVYTTPTINGVSFGGVLYTTGNSSFQASQQNALNTKYGAGRVIITFPTSKSWQLEFAGDWADTAVTVTLSPPYYYPDEDSVGLSGSQYTFTQTQAASAPEPDPEPEPEPDPEPTPASDEALAELGDKLDAIKSAADGLTFLAQSVAQTMGLIAGGLLWRTIIVAVRLK